MSLRAARRAEASTSSTARRRQLDAARMNGVRTELRHGKVFTVVHVPGVAPERGATASPPVRPQTPPVLVDVFA